MKVLVLASESPLPPNSGMRLRVLNLARQLARAGEVELVGLGPVEEQSREPFALRGAARDHGRLGALASAWRRPYMSAKLASRELGAAAAGTDADTIHAEPPYLFAAARRGSAPVVLGAQNVETEVMESFADTENRPLHRLRWRWEARKTERFERGAAQAAAAVSVPSDHDAEVFERWGAKRIAVVPNGVDTAAIEHRAPATGTTLLYIGQYGYRPNVLAARELVAEILPRVPGARARLVGREADAELQRIAGESVVVAGEVEDAIAEFHSARALVVPLRAGGGTRLKVLEALAAGTPVVSTPFGVSGLGLEHGTHVLVGETSADLALLAQRVVDDDALAASLSEQGRRLVEARYDWSVVARPLVDLHRELARR